jgi:hypothetical protein
MTTTSLGLSAVAGLRSTLAGYAGPFVVPLIVLHAVGPLLPSAATTHSAFAALSITKTINLDACTLLAIQGKLKDISPRSSSAAGKLRTGFILSS